MLDNFKKFLNEEQDPAAVEKVTEKLKGIIMNGETLEYIAVQKKPAVNISPDCVALTNKRIIFCRPKNLGFSMDFSDYVWKDVIDCKLKEELLGAIFSINTTKGSDSLDYLPKAQARRLYALAQEQEETQRELRRQMELEEKRAASGSIQVNSNPTAPNSESQTIIATEPVLEMAAPIAEEKKVDDITSALQKLKSLFENQLISREEYDAKKAEVLSRI
jgi:Bacterial PH domain/Short C-terminal domain